MDGGCPAGKCDGPVFLDASVSPTTKNRYWATDVADLVKWNVSSLKVDSVENANVTRNFNLTHADWFHTSAVPTVRLEIHSNVPAFAIPLGDGSGNP
jgi:hypothetical protein